MSDESRTRKDEQRRKYRKMDKRAKDKLVTSPRENGGGWDDQKDLHSRTGRDEKRGKTQEKMERGSRKRSSSAGREKMDRVGGRKERMEGHCSTGQSPQWAVVPLEEEEEEEDNGIKEFSWKSVRKMPRERRIINWKINIKMCRNGISCDGCDIKESLRSKHKNSKTSSVDRLTIEVSAFKKGGAFCHLSGFRFPRIA